MQLDISFPDAMRNGLGSCLDPIASPLVFPQSICGFDAAGVEEVQWNIFLVVVNWPAPVAHLANG